VWIESRVKTEINRQDAENAKKTYSIDELATARGTDGYSYRIGLDRLGYGLAI
jgi:hypothetical protein